MSDLAVFFSGYVLSPSWIQVSFILIESVSSLSWIQVSFILIERVCLVFKFALFCLKEFF